MSTIGTYAASFLQDNDGNLSSKRLVTLFSAILIGIGFLANLFWG